LLARIKNELGWINPHSDSDLRKSAPSALSAATFPAIRVARAPARLDIMGGIADYTGSLVCELTLDRAVAVALQHRPDRELQIFSFNLFDDHLPFTFRISLDALAHATIESLRHDFNQPGRKWAAYIAGCLFILHHHNLIDLKNPHIPGLNLAIHSTIPMAAGLASSAALEVATMLNLLAHFEINLDPLRIASLCQQVENDLVGAPCGIMDQVTSLLGEKDQLLRLLCQPAQLQPPLKLPDGIRLVGIDSGVRHTLSTKYALTRTAAFMGHNIILQEMKKIGERTNHPLTADPTHGYLANLDPDDYKSLFRPHLPEKISGQQFLDTFGPTIDPATTIHHNEQYNVINATDHHVLESRRVKQFCQFLEQADPKALHKAGHLMYASHHSYTHDAHLGHENCDLLIQLIRQHEHLGLYGARITAAGQGGTIAVLADTSQSSTDALHDIMKAYHHQTGQNPTLFTHSSRGAIHTGSQLLNSDF
jgi:galactokinase